MSASRGFVHVVNTVVLACLAAVVGSALVTSPAQADVGPPPAAPPVPAAITVLDSPTHPSETSWYTSRSVGLHWEGSPVSWSAGGWHPAGAMVDDVEVVGDVAFLASHHSYLEPSEYEGLVMLDVSDTAHPAVLGDYTGTADFPSSVLAFERVAVQGDYAYVGGWYASGGERYFVAVVDVSDPSSPELVDRLDLVATAMGALLFRDGYVYMTSENGTEEAWLDVVDARDPTQLVYAGGCEVPRGVGALASSQMAFEDGFLYIPTDSGGQLTVADANDPGSPTVVTTLADDCVQPCVDGSQLFAFDKGSTSSAVNVFDIADPQSVHLEGVMSTHPSSGPWLHATGCLVESDRSLSRRYLFGNLELQWYDAYNGYWLDFTEVFDVTQPLPDAGLVGDLDVGMDYSSLCFANSSLYGGMAVLGGSANGLWISHVGPDGYSYSFDQDPTGVPDTTPDGGKSGLGADLTVTAPADGVYYFHVRAVDHAGNWSPTVTRKVQIGSDKTPPTTSASGYDANWHKTAVTVTFSATDTGGSTVAYTEYKLDGAATWTRGTSCTVPAPTDHAGDGPHTVSFRSVDTAGNVEDPAKTCQVKIDTTPPVVTDNADDLWHPGGWTLTANASDALSGVYRWYVTDNGFTYITTGTGRSRTYDTWRRGGGSGIYSISYNVVDRSGPVVSGVIMGNATGAIQRTVKIDAKSPRTGDDAPLTAAGLPVPQSQALTVHLTAWDQEGLSGVKTTYYKLDGGDWTQGTSVTVPAVNGYHFISYYSVDNAGNRESTRSCAVRMVIAAKVVHRGPLTRRR